MKNKNSLNPTYAVGLLFCLVLIFWGLLAPASFDKAANAAFSIVGNNFGWWYVFVMSAFVVFSVWIGFFSKYKDIKLGPDDEEPEYPFITWFAMLFSAGMGIGLVFWGTAEPLNYWVNPISAYEPGSAAAAQWALGKAFLHWGLHPWANYCVIALGLAYFWFRKNTPTTVSAIFTPLLGEHAERTKIGRVVDILAIFATVAGVATSLGLGAYQINSGLNMLFGIPENNTALVTIIVVITIAFIGTAVAGIEKGIASLSNANVAICAVVALGCLLVGPTIPILKEFFEGTGYYLQNFIGSSLESGSFSDGEWYSSWTLFYWGWWIAWAPFTGTFVARVSKGRTIKEFCTGVLLVPALVSILWFTIFGVLGMNTGLEVAKEAIQNTSTALFVVLQHYPLGSIISMVVVVLLSTFFITSANSATFVLGMLATEGDPDPSTKTKIIWGIIQAATALALMLFTSNGLNSLQTVSIVGALPFSFIMAVCMYSFVKALKGDKAVTKLPDHK